MLYKHASKRNNTLVFRHCLAPGRWPAPIGGAAPGHVKGIFVMAKATVQGNAIVVNSTAGFGKAGSKVAHPANTAASVLPTNTGQMLAPKGNVLVTLSGASYSPKQTTNQNNYYNWHSVVLPALQAANGPVPIMHLHQLCVASKYGNATFAAWLCKTGKLALAKPGTKCATNLVAVAAPA